MSHETTNSGVLEKPLRVDAERHRQSLLCAAASVFLAEGLGASLESVAQAAGVGIATLYRRFPSRDVLVEAVFEAKMSAYADRAEVAASQAPVDPWGAFAGRVRELAETQAVDPAFGTVLLRPMQGSALFADAHGRALRATRRLVSRARKARVVRADLRETDLYLFLVSVAAIVANPGPLGADAAAHRMAELFLDAVKGPAL